MTRKDYIFIARMIKYNTCLELEDSDKLNKKALILDLCNVFEDDNKLFNRNRFIKACE